MSDTFNHEMDAWSSLEEDDGPPCYIYPKLVTCKYCGKKGFTWKTVSSGKWRLFKYNRIKAELELHACKL